MKIKRELKYATFEYDEDEKSIIIETKSGGQHPNEWDESDERPINGRIKLNKVYAFALMRFVVRIAQRNWFRKVKKAISKDLERDEDGHEDIKAFNS